MAGLDRIPLAILVMAALTLGLAPFVPEPHLWQKLRMLAAGELARPMDIFDLVLHAAQGFEFGGEIQLEVDQMRQIDRLELQLALAHQRHDDAAPH